MQTYHENVILVQAGADLTCPYRPSFQLVNVDAFRHEYVVDFKRIVRNLVWPDLNGLDLSEIKESGLNVLYAKVWQVNSRNSTEVFPQGDAGTNRGNTVQADGPPVGRNGHAATAGRAVMGHNTINWQHNR